METHWLFPLWPHTDTIIFLHDYDSTANEICQVFLSSKTNDGSTVPEHFPSIKWIFPLSNTPPDTRFGKRISQWFEMTDPKNPEVNEHDQRSHLHDSVYWIGRIILQELTILPSSRIILGGIGQGSATAAYALLCVPFPLGGFIGFRAWLPFRLAIDQVAANKQTENVTNGCRAVIGLENSDGIYVKNPANAPLIFSAYAHDDPTVGFKLREGFAMSLSRLGMTVIQHFYKEGGHFLHQAEAVNDLVEYLNKLVWGKGILSMEKIAGRAFET